MDESEFTHTDATGTVDMVDIGDKEAVQRRAIAEGRIQLQPATIEAIESATVSKGNVLATARIGAIQAVKHTWETVPMCHQIPISNVTTAFTVDTETITLTVAVETTAKTGCEMEALMGVSTGLNVIWDMVKAVEKTDDGQYPATRITDIQVLDKQKGTPD